MSKPTKKALARFEDRHQQKFGSTLKRGTGKNNYEVTTTGSLMLDLATGIGGFVEGRLYEFWGPDSLGKGHPVDEPVLTPTGWCRVGDLQEGDEVIGSEGRPTEVIGVYDRGVLPVYRVTFNDGASVLCDGDHLWRVRASKGWVTYDTRTLHEDKTLQCPDGANRYEVPKVAPIEHPSVRLPIDPYLMGVLIANGHLSGTPVIRTQDEYVVHRVTETSGEVVKEHTYENSTARGLAVHDLRDRLRVLGLYDTRSGQKFIPEAYLFADRASRWALLQGLMDCDGSVLSSNTTTYHTSSRRLATDVQALVRSLGGLSRINEFPREHPDGRPYSMFVVSALVDSNPFLTPGKWQGWRAPKHHARRMVSIEPVGREEVRCIKVAAEDSLYVARDYVVTHNTTLATIAMSAYQRKYPDRFVAVVDVEGTFDEEWAVTHGMDMDRFYLVHPDTAEETADEMTYLMVEAREKFGIEFGFVFVDSIGAMLTEAEHEKDAGEATVGGAANIITRMVKKAARDTRKYKSIVVMANQIRANIGKYGKDTDTPGGFALKHSSTMKFHVKQGGEPIKEKREGEKNPVTVGRVLAIRLDRNKVAPPFRTAEVVLFHEASKYGLPGIDTANEAFQLGTRFGVIQKAGGWYSIPEFGLTKEDRTHLNGGDRVTEWLREHPEAVERIREVALASVAGEVYEQEISEPDGEVA